LPLLKEKRNKLEGKEYEDRGLKVGYLFYFLIRKQELIKSDVVQAYNGDVGK
jgi:hypothetical protein